jgi:hypothetical protein
VLGAVGEIGAFDDPQRKQDPWPLWRTRYLADVLAQAFAS